MRIGFTCSTFDLFHTGHVIMLEEAKSLCDHLVVGLHTDPTIDRNWKNKPVQSVMERFIQVAACRYVDDVVVYESEHDLYNFLVSYPIDIRFLGEEYRDQSFTGMDLDIPIHFTKRRHDYSTTSLRDRVIKEGKGD